MRSGALITELLHFESLPRHAHAVIGWTRHHGARVLLAYPTHEVVYMCVRAQTTGWCSIFRRHISAALDALR